MALRTLLPALLVLLTLLPNSDCSARGFGGGGGRGGGGFGGGGAGGSRGPGGFSGGGGRSNFGGASGFGGAGGYGGAGRSNFGGAGGHSSFGGAGGFGGAGAAGRSNFGGPGGYGGAGNFDGAGGIGGASNFNRGQFGGAGQSGFGGQNFGGDRFGAGGAGNFSGAGQRDSFGDRFSSGAAPSRSQLGNFLGLPSDEGLHNLSNSGGGAFDVNHGTATGPRGGTATGTTVTGPGGNTYARGAAVGPNGGVVAGRGVEGANGGKAGQAVAVGPNGRVVAGGAAVGPNGGAAARGFAAGPNGVAAGFARVSPSGRYTAAAAVRGNFNHYNYYHAGWYRNYPGAWFATGWAVGAAWNAATWDSVDSYCGYEDAQPVYYDYGNNVTYQDNDVYVNGQDVGTSEQYYDQAASLATAGAEADAPNDGDWLPLGVFSLSKSDHPSSNLVVQLAVSKAGIIRGNYTDTVTEQTQVIQGSVDKSTQRVAFTVGDNKTTIVETGLYNLTKDEAPALMHFGQDRTEQWLLVRLKNQGEGGDDAAESSTEAAAPAAAGDRPAAE